MMKLPISYLLDCVSEYLEDTEFEDSDVEYLVERPVFVTRDQILKGGRLYLTERKLSGNIRQETGAFLFGREQGFHSFCIKEDASIFTVSNKIHQLFDEADQWQRQMKEISIHGTLEDILKLAGKYLPRYLAVMDPDFQVVERYLGDEETSADIHRETGYLKMEIVNILKQDGYYDAVENYQKPFLYEAKGLKNRFLCVNLLEDGEYRGRINMREEPEREFVPWESFFLESVRDVILPVFLRSSKKQRHTQLQRAFVQMLLDGKENYQNELYLFLEDVGWQEKGVYVCACLQAAESDEITDEITEETIRYYAKEIEFLMEETVCIPFEQRIFLLHYIKDPSNEKENFSKLNYFIRESNFRIGMSRKYRGITKTCSARTQAQIALDFGIRYLKQQWKYRFDEVVLFYLSECCLRELPPDCAGHSAFTVLEEQDKRTGSKLNETLECFIKNDFNMVHTADELFIHRGTLIYRLNKIRELSGVRWDTWRDKMYLAFSLELKGYWSMLNK